MPTVLNNKKDKITPGAVYVGRPSKWGNPYKLGRDGNRNQVILKYRAWLESQLHTKRLDIAELKGKDLVCWCEPKPCHAEVLLAFANPGEFESNEEVTVRCNHCLTVFCFFPMRVQYLHPCECGNQNWGFPKEWLENSFGDFTMISRKQVTYSIETPFGQLVLT